MEDADPETVSLSTMLNWTYCLATWVGCVVVALMICMSGALVADVLDIRMKTALPAIAAGVVIAGCIVALVTTGVIHLF